MHELWGRWSRRRGGHGGTPSAPPATSAIEAQAQLQALRLDLAERDRLVARLRDDLARLRDAAGALSEDTVRAHLERLFADAAAPVAQLTTQAHLAASASAAPDVADVLAVAGRLLRVLADHGLEVVGAPGDTAAFDPSRHEALAADDPPAPGETVVVRFAAVAHRGKLLRKAGVARVRSGGDA